ncbi:MAG: hypothetical protein HFJ25_03605 [Clostridia bacterium]|nr:hypothetical protein [Clostridia bacterium]
MITFFIFYKDLKYATFLSSAIIQTNNNINLIGIDDKISESSIDICNKSCPHIIITDENTHKKLSKILEFKYITITISQNETLMIQKICNQVKKFTYDFSYTHKLDLYNFKKYVYNKLKDLKFNINFCGTKYLIDCIIYAHDNPRYHINQTVLKKFYKLLAKKYNTNENSINWNIHSTILDMCKSTDSEFRKNVYGIDFGITPQQIIQLFSDIC